MLNVIAMPVSGYMRAPDDLFVPIKRSTMCPIARRCC